MSKIFFCIFPYSKKSKSTNEADVKNTGFLDDNMNSSVCEMSYHHVEDVSKKNLQEKIRKLEKEKAALVEMMIYQHENYKTNPMVQEKFYKKEKRQNSNHYTKVGKRNQNKYYLKPEVYEENTYDYIDFH
ncbi:hypothetical protein L5515_014903 [Caenorhabditis briggsae]|uniref:Uncharacterized protein n=1 Tax=Caenorhabditis briggsae TaxID=6238 RepID=A0AAE9J850_CAEBR|nr:hypothetical protein L5515_014903 [Caenorhabditis briggsae]